VKKVQSYSPAGKSCVLSGAPKIGESSICEYVFEPEPSVVKAGLLDELAGTLAQEQKEVFFFKADEHRTLLTSPKLVESHFFKDTYRTVGRIDFDLIKLKGLLRSEKAKNVVLRLDIDPGNTGI